MVAHEKSKRQHFVSFLSHKLKGRLSEERTKYWICLFCPHRHNGLAIGCCCAHTCERERMFSVLLCCKKTDFFFMFFLVVCVVVMRMAEGVRLITVL